MSTVILPEFPSTLTSPNIEPVLEKEPITPSSDIYITIVLTESIASNLNMKLKHLHEVPTKNFKTNLLLMSGDEKGNCASSSKKIDDLNDWHVDIAFFRTVHMEDSSTSFYHSTGSYDEEMSEDDIGIKTEEHNFYLAPFVARVRSLKAVRSLAHDGNLYIDSNGIYVTVYNLQLPAVSSDWVNMCRICYASDSNEHLIAPCNCKGTIALVHFTCLERWLRDSGKNKCELCQNVFQITRTPKYSIPTSILVWMCNSSRERRRLLEDFLALCVYTPVVLTTSNMLMVIFELCLLSDCTDHCVSAAFLAFCALTGIAIIDCTFTSWFLITFNRHVMAWSHWYRENSIVTLILPPRKLRRCRNITYGLEDVD